MLVLTRKLKQQILIGDNVVITVHKVKGNSVRIGIEAPKSVLVRRGELLEARPAKTEVTISAPLESRIAS